MAEINIQRISFGASMGINLNKKKENAPAEKLAQAAKEEPFPFKGLLKQLQIDNLQRGHSLKSVL